MRRMRMAMAPSQCRRIEGHPHPVVELRTIMPPPRRRSPRTVLNYPARAAMRPRRWPLLLSVGAPAQDAPGPLQRENVLRRSRMGCRLLSSRSREGERWLALAFRTSLGERDPGVRRQASVADDRCSHKEAKRGQDGYHRKIEPRAQDRRPRKAAHLEHADRD